MRRLWGIVFSCLLAVSAAAEGGKPYAIEVRSAPIHDIVRMLAKMEGKNVVVPSGIQQRVTASFAAIELEKAMEAILEANNLGMIDRFGVLRVTTREELEKLGEDLKTRTFNLSFAKAADVKQQVETMVSKRGSVMLDARTNAITVRDTPVYMKDVETLIVNVDRQDEQVLIEARVVEANVEYIRNLGIQWGVTDAGGEFRISGLTAIGTGDATRKLVVNSAASSPLAGVALALGPFGGAVFDTQLTAAESEGEVAILSRPSIVTMNNQAATIHSGVKFYVKTNGDVSIGGSGSSGSTSSNLEEIEAGITMTVTPQITDRSKIHLNIDVTESQPDFANTVDGIPSILDNNAATHVTLANGETTVIGGLFQLQKTRTEKGVPGLHRIPLFGRLFGSKSKGTKKKELVIFITPTIVHKPVSHLDSFVKGESTVLDFMEERAADLEKLQKKEADKKNPKPGRRGGD